MAGIPHMFTNGLWCYNIKNKKTDLLEMTNDQKKKKIMSGVQKKKKLFYFEN